MKRILAILSLAFSGCLHAQQSVTVLNNGAGQGTFNTPGVNYYLWGPAGTKVDFSQVTVLGISGGGGGGGGTPGGINTQVQYNNEGAFGGASGLTWSGNALANSQSSNAGLQPFQAFNTNAGTGANVGIWAGNGTDTVRLGLTGVNYSGAYLTSGPSGEIGALTTSGAQSLVFGTNTKASFYVDTSQNVDFIGHVVYPYNTAFFIKDSGGTARAFFQNSLNVYEIGDIFDTGYETQIYSGAAQPINFVVNASSVGSVTSTGLNSMAIGSTTASTGAFTTLAASGTSTLTGNVTVGATSTSNVNNTLIIFGSNASDFGPFLQLADATGLIGYYGSQNAFLGGTTRNLHAYAQNAFTVSTNNGTLALTLDTSQGMQLAKESSRSYNDIATAGNGVAAVVSAPRSGTVTNALWTPAAYTTPAVDSSYEVSANINVTTSTTVTMTCTCTYTDETNTSRVLTLGFTNLAGATIVSSITTALGNVPYEGLTYHIRCKASSTITFATAGTVTNVVYTAEANARQIN